MVGQEAQQLPHSAKTHNNRPKSAGICTVTPYGYESKILY